MIVIAAMRKAINAPDVPPAANAVPARPTRMGPVHPKPASGYPNPKMAKPSTGLRRRWRA